MAKGNVGDRIRVILAEYNHGYQNGDTGIILGFVEGLSGAEIRIDGAMYYSEDETHYLYPQEYEIIQEEAPIQEGNIQWEVGQEVWDAVFGKGCVDRVFEGKQVQVRYADKIRWYTPDGVLQTLGEAKYRSLFFSEPKIIADKLPPKKKFVPVLNRGDVVIAMNKEGTFEKIVVNYEDEECVHGFFISWYKSYWTFHKPGEKVEFNV